METAAMKKVKSDANQWLVAMKTAKSLNVDKVPAGWKTIAQIAIEVGMSPSRVRTIVSDLVNRKKVLYKRFRVGCGRRGSYPVYHYYIKNQSYELKGGRN